MRSRRDVIAKMQRAIENAKLMTPARKEMFAGMYFQCAERVADRVSRKEARQIWRDAHSAGVIDAKQLRQGLRYFHLFRFPSLRQSQRHKLEQSWPPNFFIRRTATYLKTPLHRGELPAISAVMSAYNAGKYLRESIDSILAQTFGDWEFIVIDDGSTDDTLSILRQYESRDKRFRIISRPNTGLTRALNEGVAAAGGEFIARMDADDISLPQRFEKQISYLRSHPDCVLLGAQIELIDPLGLKIALDSRKLNHDEIDAELLAGKGGAVVHPVCMLRIDALRKLRAYREQYNNSEDLDLFLRLAEVGRIANLPDVLLKYRRHPESVSHQKYENQWRLKKQIVAEAYQRRGLKMPEDWTFTPWKPKPVVIQLREWAWAALKAGKIGAARKHAMSVFKKAPFSSDSWRLMFCALRGR
jgi:glycosyltransferase involved in cell wall biosynthesis